MAASGAELSLSKVIYEVNVSVDLDTADAYIAWLKGHAVELLEVPGFESAEIFERKIADGLESGLSENQSNWTAQYLITSRQHLQDYFDHHAARFRGDGVKRFEGKFEAKRRVLHVVPGAKFERRQEQ